MIPYLLDSYAKLMLNNPSVMTQNIQTVISMTENRTDAQTLAAIHDDRTNQQYSVMNGLGGLTSLFLTGSGASASGATPTSLTQTTYAVATLQNFANNINYLNSASWGTTTFANGTATPLASAVNFINNIVRANSSTEPPKRTFERYMGTNSAISPLDSRYASYSVLTGGLTTADTANFVVPSYFSNFTLPSVYATTTQWVQGFTVTQEMIDANGGKAITAPYLGTYDSAGNFIPESFTVGQYVPGIGTAPRPFRLSTSVNVPTLLRQVANTTNPYADGAFPSGHTNSAWTQALGLAFVVPQEYQSLLLRASDLGNDRILAGMHSPLDVIGGRIEATAIAATNIYGALYDATGNRLDWTNSANSTAYSVYQAYTQTQNYLAQACGTATVAACLAAQQLSGATASARQDLATYTQRLTYGFTQIGPTDVAEVVPVQAQVLLLTRLPYLTDQQRTDVLQSTALASGYPLLDGNTWDGWGRLNLYAAANGYGSFAKTVTVSMDASQGGYSALDSWSNDITGTGGLVKQGTGTLALTGNDTYTGDTVVAGGTLVVSGSIASSNTSVQSGGTLSGAGTIGPLTVQSGGTVNPDVGSGTLSVKGAVNFQPGSTYAVLLGTNSADNLSASGSATIGSGSSLKFLNQGFQAALGQDFDILQASGGVNGKFDTVTSPSVSLATAQQLRLLYGTNRVDLFVTPSYASLGGIGASANEASAGRAIDALGAGATSGDTTTMLASLYGLSSMPAALNALDQINGVTHANLVAADQARALATVDLLNQRMASLRDGAGSSRRQNDGLQMSMAGKALMASVAPANGSQTVERQKADGDWNLWTQGLGQIVQIGNSGGTRGIHANTAGGMVGVDRQVTPDMIAGFAGGIAKTETNGSGDITSYTGAVYANSDLGPVFVAANLGYTFDQYNSRRAMVFGTVNRIADGNADGDDVTAGLRTGTRVSVSGVILEPSVGLQWLRSSRDAFTESDAGAFDLAVSRLDHSPLQGDAGVRAATRWTDDSLTFEPELRVGWLHDLHDRQLTSRASLAGGALAATGPKTGRDAATLGIGLSAGDGSGLTLYVNYDGDYRTRENDQSITAGLRYSW